MGRRKGRAHGHGVWSRGAHFTIEYVTTNAYFHCLQPSCREQPVTQRGSTGL